jgi:hypothetical protein
MAVEKKLGTFSVWFSVSFFLASIASPASSSSSSSSSADSSLSMHTLGLKYTFQIDHNESIIGAVKPRNR